MRGDQADVMLDQRADHMSLVIVLQEILGGMKHERMMGHNQLRLMGNRFVNHGGCCVQRYQDALRRSRHAAQQKPCVIIGFRHIKGCDLIQPVVYVANGCGFHFASSSLIHASCRSCPASQATTPSRQRR